MLQKPKNPESQHHIVGFHVVYHFFQLPAAAPLAAVDAAGAQFCGLTWAEVDRTRGLEKQARLQRISSYALYPIPYALNPPVTVGLAALLTGRRRLPPSPKARKTLPCTLSTKT